MDEITSGLDPDDLMMDLDEPEGSDLEEDDEELIDDPIPSPFLLSSGQGSTTTSVASSPINEEFPPPFNFTGKPLNIKRGRGRPKREGGKPSPRAPRSVLAGMNRVKKPRPPGFNRRGAARSFRQLDRTDFDMSLFTPSPIDDHSLLDSEGALIFPERDRPGLEEPPYFPEHWTGKVCALCNLGERSQLGQGDMLRLNCPEGFSPQKVATEQSLTRALQTPDRESGDKSPRGPVTCRRQKSFNKCRHPSITNEYIDELTIIGYNEVPDVMSLFEQNGQFYVHRSCALWSHGVSRAENSALLNVGPIVLQSSSKKCSFCNHYGASLACNVDGCGKFYHFPCATASGAFQELMSLTTFCSSHLDQVALLCDSSICYTCRLMGDVANLMFCSTCGSHYHGTCVGLAQLPGVRAGWQCRKCRSCQVCRITGDESKLMSCEQCDKVYHAGCQRPIVTSIPKYGWKCRCCRVCGDCGSRTPGAGLSSRWHAHYTVCDSCYQQRNKGYSCPLCHKAYRAHAHREMVQCTNCKKFVHGTCDPEADLVTYHQKRELNPEYEYVCLHCKNHNGRQVTSKRASTDDPGDLSVSQESLYDDTSEFDLPSPDEFARNMGLGKGKPYTTNKIAKKRFSFPPSTSGRPKGQGKTLPGKAGFMKRARLTDFGRKRGHKAKMRGIFGVPGVGLQRPVADGKNDEEPGVENRLVLCSAKDKFILTQDTCVMCGALGTDQEGCLIGCVQCGQCYHPYCVNVKVTKVILQKGWRCLDCTVCEGCGQRNDEGRLILCDDCDVSYHIYCMDPPLDYVPHGNWKCKWCAICQTCGATDPGFNCTWMNSCTECGPCASHVNCPSCTEPYSEGDLIIQCVQCERWLHGLCDSIKTDEDAEKCAEDGYNCILCRPRDVPPPHLIPAPAAPKPPTPTKSPEMTKNTNYFIDGVCLSEFGNSLIKSLAIENHGTRKKRKKIPTVQDKEAGIMATIESVVAGGSIDNSLEDSTKLELVDVKEEPQEIFKEGMFWTKEDGPPPEGFTVITLENGISVLRRKRQRNLQKLGIGGFLVRMRGNRSGQDNEENDTSCVQSVQTTGDLAAPLPTDGEKPRRKPVRRKPKSKLAETFPSYLQEAFFGKDLLETVDCKKEVESGSSDDENIDKYKSIKLSQDELMAVAAVTGKQEKLDPDTKDGIRDQKLCSIIPKVEDEDENTEDLKDVLALPGDLLDTDLVNSIINEDDELTKNTESLGGLDTSMPDDSELADTLGSSGNSKDTKDELSDILGPHFNLDSISNINSKDVEDIFKGVLTDESQESQESNVFPLQGNSIFSGNAQQALPQHTIVPPIRPTTLSAVNQSNLNSPVSFPPPSPYHSEYSNSPQFSPAFSEPPSPWVSANEPPEIDSTNVGVPSTYNQRSSEKMKADEGLGNGATISAVLYANMNHPEWKKEFPGWSDRYKQIIKKWRTLSQDQKAPYLQHARDNRSQLRMKKAQQTQPAKDQSAPPPSVIKPSPVAAAALTTTLQTAIQQAAAAIAPPPPATVSEVCTQTRPTLTPASTSSVSVSVSPSSPPNPKHPPSSPTTHQQFTVHGHFAGPGDHVGPAPNVTVNPHYQPSVEGAPPHPRLVPPQSNASDQQIRVLTPSEIMRTLPSLCQENYEPQPLDQEKMALQQKSAREAEQERQWKQLQALRQQQAQQQQHVIHEQRVQGTAIARVQRQISSDPTQQFLSDQQSPLQASTPQELVPAPSPSPNSRPFLGIKSPTFPLPSPLSQPNIRPPTPSHSPHDFTQNSPVDSNDPYAQPPLTPKPAFQPRLPADVFAHQPATPRPQFGVPRPTLQTFTTPVRPDQLRDLLQRQQFKKLDELVPGKTQQRVWPPNEQTEGDSPTSVVVSSSDTTFRQPLPPSIVRPRMPVSIGNRPIPSPNAIRLGQIDSRLQGLDPRMRLILQQQQQRLMHSNVQGIQQQFVRFAPGARPASVEQYEQLLHRQAQSQIRGSEQNIVPRLPLNQASVIQRPQVGQPVQVQSASGNAESNTNEEGIPDNVTAELEKLEQETGTMVELQGVSDILGGLGEDDDELLAEMGADFNILEYADPELEALTGGKTNILDIDLEEESLKKDNKAGAAPKTAEAAGQPPATTNASVIKKEGAAQKAPQESLSSPAAPQQPPPLSVPQKQNVQHVPPPANQPPATPVPQPVAHPHPLLTPQQIHQQMMQQVQQAAAQGKPLLPGSRIKTPDDVVGIILPNNTIQLQVPPSYQQRLLLLQLQNQKIPMRIGQPPPGLPVPVGVNQQMPTGLVTVPRGGGIAPPPPPYPGPPPPYPGNAAQQHQQQTGLRMGPGLLPTRHFHPSTLQGFPMHPHLQRRPILLEEQPLLLEDLLEQEKREQEKLHNQPPNQEVTSSTGAESESSLLTEHDFERLNDVFNSGPVGLPAQNSQANPSQSPHQPWQQIQNRPVPTPTPQPTVEITTRVQTFNANLIPAPPLPPENIITEQDKQTQLMYEQWLNHQSNVYVAQLRYYETEVQKLRKSRKSLNSKQRQLRKSGNQLNETDAAELQRISAEQAILQKHLESSRKQNRQHSMLVQEYRNKHPAKQQQRPLPDQIQSPLGLPASSPIHHPSTSQSPMMSPSASPLTQHSSPMNSPGPIISPGSVQNLLQSPNSLPSNMSPLQTSQMQPSPMQPSPRIGTPHSQNEGSPGPAPSPSQVCLPPPVPRMTSPQHRRVVTSPVATPQMRFVNNALLQQRIRMQSPMPNFQQKPGTSSPLHSPTSQQMSLTHQLQLQKQLQQQALLQQQQNLETNQNDPSAISQRAAQILQHRNLMRQQSVQQQVVGPQPLTPHQHQLMIQQQKQLKQQQQQIAQQQIAQLQVAARLQQQQQQQQQQQLQQQQLQQQQQNPPHSPMPPKSPMVSQQIMSPHSMPPSPMQMPPKSPMVPAFGNSQPNPNSPAARSPAFHQGMGQPPTSPMTHVHYQPPSSPMPRSPMVSQNQSPHGMRRPPSANSSPAIPDRPRSEENPATRTSYSIEHLMQDTLSQSSHSSMQYGNDGMNNLNHFNSDIMNQSNHRDNLQGSGGGGNPNNPCNPIPLPPGFGRFGYIKLGLRGGAPMWNYGRGAKRIPTPPTVVNKVEEKVVNSELAVQKIRKESHFSKVSILKRKVPTKINFQSSAAAKASSLVSTDYNDLDDSSSTPPVTPPPLSLVSRGSVQKTLPKKILERQRSKESVMELHSPDNKQLDMMDYDDDMNTVLSAEVSLSSVAQNDADDMVEMETLSQQDLAEDLSSPLESDQIADEYLLFPGNMVVDMSDRNHYSDKEEEEDEEVEEDYSGENMHIVIRSPTTSDDEFIMQGKTKKYNLVPHTGQLLNMHDVSESPDQEETTAEPFSGTVDEETSNNYEGSDLLIMDQHKSPEDSISTKEDFEELIDEGSRKNNLTKREINTKHLNDFHKYANIFNYAKNVQQNVQSQSQSTSRSVPQKETQKMSLMGSSAVHATKSNTDKLILTPSTATVMNTTQTSKVTSIILTHNSAVRGNVLNVPKIVSTVSPAITIVTASTSQIASILPSKFTVPVISASAVRQLSNVKVLDKPSSSLSLTSHDSALPNKIFEDDSVSPDSSNFEDDKFKDSFEEKTKSESPTQDAKAPVFSKSVDIPNNSAQVPKIDYKSKEHAEQSKKIEHLQVTNLVSKEHVQKQRVPSPIISKTSSPVIIHNTPELKMTAQVIQETQTHMQMNATANTVGSYDGSIDDTKSVVISIPSPTPSQEQMLDNIALQALENRRREFESFEDVLDMIENITAEPPATLEETVSLKDREHKKRIDVKDKDQRKELPNKIEHINVTASKSSTIPQLSPLSQPTDLTTNMANASQQLRTLLSSLQTTSTSAPTNVESVVKSIGHKVSSTAAASQPIVASRVIQQTGRQSPVVTTVSTVIVPNLKQKIIVTSTSNARSSPIKSQFLSTVSNNATPSMGFLQTRTVGGIHLMPDHPKLPPVTTVTAIQQVVSTVTSLSNSTTYKTTSNTESKKPSLTLTAMLQNQPAASMTTKSSAETITAASLLSTTPISLPRTGFTTGFVQAQPNVIKTSAISAPSTSAMQNQPGMASTMLTTIPKSSNDIHTGTALMATPMNLTRSSFSTALVQTMQNSVSINSSSITSSASNSAVSSVITAPSYRAATSTTNLLHTQLTKVVRTRSLEEPKEVKTEDIKQEPSDGIMNTLEENKAAIIASIKQELGGCKFSSISTPLSKTEDSQNVLLKKLLQNTACASTQSPPPASVSTTNTSAPTAPRIPIRETSFVSSPTVEQSIPQTPAVTSSATQQLHIDVKKSLPPTRTPSRDELLSPQTPRSSCSQDSSLQTPPIVVKKELPCVPLPQRSPILTPHEVKKEFIDESSQHSEVSDYSRSDVQMKEEIESMDTSTEKVILDKEEIKKQKRRMYQQKRRQNQILNKELAGQPKKRPRKNSKIDEDYDSYIDSVLSQLRQLPSMNVAEPNLNRNHGVVSVFGSGDMLKLGTAEYSSQYGDLLGTYGNAELPGFSDFYFTKPYGDLDPLPEKTPASTQRGFYDQEFPLIRFDPEEHKKFDLFSREDSPDSILSSSSPECLTNDPEQRYLGLRLISDDEDEKEDEKSAEGRCSPVVPLIKPIPIRLKPAGGLYLKEDKDSDKENINRESSVRTISEQKPAVKDSGNVTVTLTLTSSAAEDIMGVLRDLANILHIPAPTSYQIVERSTPPSQKLGLYRTKGRDGKEGAPIDIQSILNGSAKFCKLCDIVILNNIIRKKVSDLPCLAKEFELLSDADEIYFCSVACYTQALTNRSLTSRTPGVIEDKMEEKHKIPLMESFDSKSIIAQRLSLGNREFKREYQSIDNKDFSSYFHDLENSHGSYHNHAEYKPMPIRMYKNLRYKYWGPGCLQPNQKHKKPTDKEIMELLYRMQITVTPITMPVDTRKCMFCQGVGDGVADGPARLLNFDVDKWVHLNCGLWSDGVYETVNGALMNLENAIQTSLTTTCIHCNKLGATIRCFKTRCSSVYHLSCAVKDRCVFYKNKTVYCTAHIPKNEKDNELTTLSVSRRVYVNRDENRQVASVMHNSDTNNLLRVGSLIFLSVGQLLPHQLQNFHTPNYIYPIGYKIIRFYWSMRRLNKRCRYVCSIHDICGRPEFRVLVQEHPEEDVEFKDQSPKGAWNQILDQTANMRREHKCLQLFPKFATGEDLFGLTEPAIVRVLESLPGIETLTDYKFKYGRNPLLELPLAINPSGSARTEPRLRSQMHWKRPHTQRTTGATIRPMFGPSMGPVSSTTTLGDISCPYSKQFVHSKSSQYKKMKQEWRNNVYLARSKIQGLGLYAAKDLEKHTMVIEYIGEMIRTELAECREKQYEAKNRGIYMFRLDEERVVDATLCGGLARYINHSCNPNCVAEQVEVERDVRIIIFAKRRIQRGEELCYDYKFDIEDDQHKISCMCGAPNCRKWMN